MTMRPLQLPLTIPADTDPEMPSPFPVPEMVAEALAEGGRVRGTPLALEPIWRPLWDTQFLGREASPYARSNLMFFCSPPDGRTEAHTNVTHAGQLSWPQRFVGRGITLHASAPLPRLLTVELVIGELVHAKLLYQGYNKDRHFLHFPTPDYYIPTVQNFRLELADCTHSGPMEIRATLPGWLIREKA